MVREERESRNHLCWSEVWLTTKSRMMRMLRFLAFGDQAIEIGQRAVHGVDGFVVGDVIAEIDLRRREARGDPDGVDAELVQVIELGGDAVEVADAVVVAVGEAARIDLVEDGVFATTGGLRRLWN